MNTNYIETYNFKGENPFVLIPWHLDFLEEIENLCHAFSAKPSPSQYAVHTNKSTQTHNTSDLNKQNIILVFPHNRPKRYIENRYKKMAQETGKAHILPHIMTGADFQRTCLLHFERGKKPYQELSSLDRMYYLHEAVIRVAKSLPKSSVLRRLLEIPSYNKESDPLNLSNDTDRKLSMAKFIPWANSLDKLFEECFTQLLHIANISYADDEVNAFAAAILSQLRDIHKEYIHLLQDNTINTQNINTELYRASTPAFSAYRCAQFINAYTKYMSAHTSAYTAGQSKNDFYAHDFYDSENNSFDLGITSMSATEQKDFFDNFIPDIFRDKIIIFAGFVHLTKAEDTLFRFFWQKGACFALHTDPNIYYNNEICQEMNTSVKNEFQIHSSVSVHYSCNMHIKWLQSWKASCILFPYSKPNTAHKQKIHFFSAYDSHSQIQAVKSDLMSYFKAHAQEHKAQKNLTNNNNKPIDSEHYCANLADDDVALILPDPSLLMPLLHELPEKDVNISMGYPISRTLFGQWIELLLALQEGKNKETSNYIWKEILTLLRHPYAHMLTPPPLNSQTAGQNPIQNLLEDTQIQTESETNLNASWRSVLYFLEHCLREGAYSINLTDFLDTYLDDRNDFDELGDFNIAEENQRHKKKSKNKNTKKSKAHGKAKELLLQENLNEFAYTFFEVNIQDFENIQSLQELARCIESFIAFLLAHGSSLWQRFPLEAESITLCVERILPKLRDNALSYEVLPQEVLFKVLRELITNERIPFEADPLQGMQILGMLETRLLRFKNVFLLDMTEDNVPGTPIQDSLIPNSIRKLLSLPDVQTRDHIVAHTFYRLIASAEHIWLYWQEGVQASDIQTSKHLPSRFVEECLWQEEQRAKTTLHKNSNIVRKAPCVPNTPTQKNKKEIITSLKIKEALLDFLQEKLSATALNTYIQCPAKFFYTYLLKLGEIEEIREGNDPKLFGTWLHNVFCETYKHSDKNGIFIHNEANFSLLMEIFKKNLALPEVADFTSSESFFMLKNVAHYHLEKYWKSMPYAIKPIALEQTFTCDFTVTLQNNTITVPLLGVCDRVDIRTFDDVSTTFEATTSTENLQYLFEKENNLHYVIDYKTGKKEKLNEKIWNNDDFWNLIEKANAEEIYQDDLKENKQEGIEKNKEHAKILREIAKFLPNIQLPFYVYVYTQNFPHVMCNASWIFLGEDEPEISLVKVNNAVNSSVKQVTSSLEKLQNIEAKQEGWQLLDCIKNKRMPSLLTFLLKHMLETDSFPACEGKACMFCPHKNYC